MHNPEYLFKTDPYEKNVMSEAPKYGLLLV